MGEVDFDKSEGPVKFEEGKRYKLIVMQAEEGLSSVKQTPFLKLHLQTAEGVSAYDHTIYLTPKALGFAQEWFKAMGLPTQGKVKYDPERLGGIRLTAECYLEPYTVNQGTADEKTYHNTRWRNPEPVTFGGAAPARQEESAGGLPF
jgi:hypothetical protein